MKQVTSTKLDNQLSTDCSGQHEFKECCELITLKKYAVVNDHHSELNETFVSNIRKPKSEVELAHIVAGARATNQQIAIAGGRHAMGGQQFRSNAMLVDMSEMNAVLSFDAENGLIQIESGIMWPALINHLKTAQVLPAANSSLRWTIAQKQTGCDMLTIGGALAANVHGRGLNKAPIVEDVESFRMVMFDGSVRICSRFENRELFGLAIGGYGAFGVISAVTLRLVPQVNLRRQVRVCASSDAIAEIESSHKSGATFGDFQFAIDHTSEDFLQIGIVSTYTPVETDVDADVEVSQRKLLNQSQWEELLFLAHYNKSAAFEKYKQHYLSTNGQIYCSDTFQSATYINGYHRRIDEKLGAACKGSDAITELYVPRARLGQFMQDTAAQLRSDNANVIYGTVRLINRDVETFLPWASENWACVILNLHVQHEASALSNLENTFRNLYALAIKYGGKYYLTYNKFAAPKQVLTCYPNMPEFLAAKRKFDPEHRFTSNWIKYIEECVSFFR